MLSCEEEAYLDYATTHVVDEVFIHVDAIQKQEDFLKKMILEFEKMGVVVALNLDLFDLGLSGEKRIDNLEQYHVVAFTSRLFDYRMVVLKRLIGYCGSTGRTGNHSDSRNCAGTIFIAGISGTADL